MNRKSFLPLILFLITGFVSAQNIQLHFDPRHALHKDDFGKNYFTTTFEMFKPDKWGSTFGFVDLDFNQSRGNIGLAYMEIMRDQNIGKLPIRAHVEFNGGLASWGNLPNAYLAGASYATNIGGFNLTTYLAYKYHAFARVSNDVQWTGIWGGSLFNNKLTICGFIDIWTENKDRTQAKTTDDKKIVLLTEPQFWYNVNTNLSFGTEIEISNNFLPDSRGKDKAYVNPTIAAKWTF